MIRVLVVDDDFMVARVHRGLVDRVPGFTVVGEARTGAEALEQVQRHRPDLVLLDIYLPDIDGLAVLRELRATAEFEVDVLPITAARDADTVRRALRGGAVHYIVKPFDPAVLRERLADYQATRRRLAHLDSPRQHDIDRVFGAAPDPAGPEAGALPKGLTPQTARLVEAALRDHGEMSATECGEHTGLSRVSARRYLEFFAESGRARVRLRYGAAGRPERRYAWTG